MPAHIRSIARPKHNATPERSRADIVRTAVDKSAGHTQALSRGLAVLEALAATDAGATLTALAARLGIPAPTAHRLLATLQAAGYVQIGATGQWRIGVRAFRVGSAFLAQRNLAVQAFAHLEALMERSGETTNLAVIESGEAVFVEQVQCRELMRMSAKLGARVPIHASAVGKAMLAAMNERRMTALLGRQPLTRHTPRTITSHAALAKEIALIRARGYAIDDEEHAAGLRCVATAVVDEHGDAWAAISLAGPTTRITAKRIPTLGALVRASARGLTEALGGRVAAPSRAAPDRVTSQPAARDRARATGR
ncbi:MAG: helix-turn-helix domain-containing protein [Burkholderiales bacterium]|nr:helix-turn-helix domain-containing protein [Burkholderiales bacterium]